MTDSKLRCLGGWLAAGWLTLLLASALPAQLPRTSLSTIFPPGGQPGTTVAATIIGPYTEASNKLRFSHPGITAVQQVAPATEYRAAHRRPGSFQVTISPDVPPGSYEVRADGPTGLSNPRIFLVSDLPQRQRLSPQEQTELSVGEVISARIPPDSRQRYRMTARQGQQLLVQVWADRLDSPLDAGVAIYNSQGKRLARSLQSTTRDPIMTFTAPADGNYVVEIWDLAFRGGDQYVYQLEVSQRPHVEAIFPPVAQTDEEGALTGGQFTVYGFNLPEGSPVLESARLGNLQYRRLALAPQQTRAVAFAQGFSRGDIASAMLSGMATRLPAPLSAANPIFLATTDLEVQVEQADNDSPAAAQSLSIPCEIAGQFYPRKDVDWFEFQAAKGDVFWIELSAHRLGASSDPSLRIRRSKTQGGKQLIEELTTQDDLQATPRSRDDKRFFAGTSDVSYRFRAAEQATYQIAVRDIYNVSSSDPRLVYRLTIRPPTPDFQLLAFADPQRHSDAKVVSPGGVNLLPGGTTAIRVRLLPLHGFTGTVAVTAENLPAGVTAWPVRLSPQLREGLIVLEAEPETTAKSRAVRVVGRCQALPAITRTARTGTIYRGVGNVDREVTGARLSRDLVVSVLHSPPPPASLRPATEVVELDGDAKAKVPLRIERREGFDAELQLAAVQVPSGIQVGKLKVRGNSAELSLAVDRKKLPPGRYSFPLTAQVKQRRPRNPLAVAEAEADVERVKQLLADRLAQLQAQQAQVEQAQVLLQAAQARAGGDQPASATSALIGRRRKSLEAQQNDLGRLQQKRDETGQQLKEAQKRLAKVKQAELAVESAFWIYSRPVQIRVKANGP